jgi:NAD(P)-dependent dehydrogenase (short-subunit alcohol dehydrogenase family)
LLVLSSRSLEKLEQLLAEIQLPEERVLLRAADVTQPRGVGDLTEAILSRFGRIDVLLNCVGGWSGGKPVAETAPEAWNSALSLNLHSAFLLSRAVQPHMVERGWGRIIHVASKTAVEPRAGQVGYAVAKMGVITLTEVLAAEVKRTGVTANVILPSIIDTPGNRSSMPRADPSRWVPPERIAGMMRFLCSDTASSINGARILIYGDV